MVLDRQHLGVTKSRCIVWGVAFLSDGTVISVDSVGKVQLWDSATGTLVKSHVIANADVQSIAVADVSMLPAQVVLGLTVLLLSLLSSQEYDLISSSPAFKSALGSGRSFLIYCLFSLEGFSFFSQLTCSLFKSILGILFLVLSIVCI